ncbi:hypothetical protein, partial [Rhizobium oryzihabitans]|uniref:hypothetical protein n=1 Tax=Rhizobium oryzihabitans TaxID=2267833 RepID=UPI004035C600
ETKVPGPSGESFTALSRCRYRLQKLAGGLKTMKNLNVLRARAFCVRPDVLRRSAIALVTGGNRT